VVVNDGNGQSAPAGSAVPISPSVKVTDVNGSPVAGVSVRFNVTAGGGSLTDDLQTTDAGGIARVGSWTLGTLGTNRLEGVVFGLESAVVTATATSGGASAAASTATVPTSGIATVATAIKVQARDANGNPITNGGATVVVSITGANTATPPVTDVGNGTYTAQYIPQALGTDQVAITMNGSPLGSSPYSSLVVAKIKGYSGTNQTAKAGTTLPTAPAVRATDGLGHVISGLSITFSVLSGGGSVTGAVQTTNSLGVARVGSWTLGPTVGTQRLRATLTGTISTATINATATAP
jgi:adhesin/invasin